MFCKAPAIIDTRIEDFLVHGRDLNVSTSCLDKGDDNTVARCGRYFLSETDTAVVVTKWYELTGGGGDRGWPKLAVCLCSSSTCRHSDNKDPCQIISTTCTLDDGFTKEQ